jgi:hypothetical protein
LDKVEGFLDFSGRAGLKIPQRVSPGIKYVPLHIHPEGHKKIDHHRRAHGKKGDINKILTDGGGINTHFCANSGTYPKHLHFYKISETVHIANLTTNFSINKHFK